jgi:hypothetical protein
MSSPPPAAFPAARPAPGVEELINGSLEELIRGAEKLQAEHVRAVRSAHNWGNGSGGGNGSVAKAAPAPRRRAPRAVDAALQEAIARIETAARAAAKGSRKD